MLRVTIELLPYGSRTRARRLGVAYIVNDGSGDEDSGNYEITLRGHDCRDYEGRVTGFPRKQAGPWDLLFRALARTIGPKGSNAAKHA